MDEIIVVFPRKKQLLSRARQPLLRLKNRIKQPNSSQTWENPNALWAFISIAHLPHVHSWKKECSPPPSQTNKYRQGGRRGPLIKSNALGMHIHTAHLPHMQQLEERVLPVGARLSEVHLADVVGHLLAVPGDALAVALHRELLKR